MSTPPPPPPPPGPPTPPGVPAPPWVQQPWVQQGWPPRPPAPRPRRPFAGVAAWIVAWSLLSALLLGLAAAVVWVVLDVVYASGAGIVGMDVTDDGSLPGPSFGTVLAWAAAGSFAVVLVVGLATGLLMRRDDGFARRSSFGQGSLSWLISVGVTLLLAVVLGVVGAVLV